MRMKKIGIWTCLLFLCMVLGYGTPVHAAQTDDPVKTGRPTRSLTALTLTGLDEPVPGVPLDTSATIVTAEGITWEIPVIWVDEHGNRVTVPVKGKKYFPAFIFYIPAGYQIADVNASGAFEIRLPDFVTELVGPEGLVFAADPANGITYVFPVNGVPADLGALLPLPSNAPVSEPEQAAQSSSSDVEIEPAPAPVPFVSAKVRMYCADSAINTLGNEFLDRFIDLLKDTLVPQAANLLREKFPQSLGAAQPGTELSSNIGLYIYYVDGEIMGNPAPASALAFNFSNADENELSNILGLDASSFTEYDEATGQWVIPDYLKGDLDNTIVHELLHSFMFDYTRYGMFTNHNNVSQDFPLWFKEGTASITENDYMFRIWVFLQFSGDATFEAFHNSGFEGLDPVYSTQNVLNGYLEPYFTKEGAYFLNPGDANPEECILDMTEDGISSYVSGYLAVAYLGYMDALYRGQTPIDANNNINVDVIRGGVDDVLKRLHGSNNTGAQSLDEIIQEISGQRYRDTDDFTAKFIKGTATAQDEYAGDTNDSGTGSLTFVSTYLTWLDSQSNISERQLANGSLLFQEQDYNSPLHWDRTETSDVYQIPEQAGMIVSSVDLTKANQTGGKGSVGNGTQDYTRSGSNRDEDASEPEQFAAKTGNRQSLEGIAVPAVDVQEDVTDEPVVGDAMVTDPADAPAEGQDPETVPASATAPDAAPAAEPVSAATPEAAPATDPIAAEAPEATPAADPAPADPEPASEPEADAEPEAESEPETESDNPAESETQTAGEE